MGYKVVRPRTDSFRKSTTTFIKTASRHIREAMIHPHETFQRQSFIPEFTNKKIEKLISRLGLSKKFDFQPLRAHSLCLV